MEEIVIELSGKDFEFFIKVLNDPPKANESLWELMQPYGTDSTAGSGYLIKDSLS